MMLTFLMCLLTLTDESVSSPVNPVSADQLRQFETEVRPVLVEHCLKCHGAEKQWAGLRLDSGDAVLQGGDSGPAVVPGAPDASLLIQAIRQTDADLRMPKDERLSDQQIASLVRWVELGAVYPDQAPTAKRHRDPDHWAFRPPEDVAVPDVQDNAWPQTDLDRFILARLEGQQLAPAPKADRRTLIRRVTFDLTGLPPTPEEIDAFIADEDPKAFSNLVERLLASPAYGERWGRHWLDVARYADSNGLDENIAHGNAWRYRDYVVTSFNSDKPFDRFIVEQIAGDLLDAKSDAERHECLTATGFLSIGPKVLAEVNQPKMRMDIVDEQIDTVGRVFMGMTFGCARCHDHKFDPIDAADYYGLAGIFKSTRTMDTYTKVAKWHEFPLKTAEAATMQAEYDAQLAAKKQAVETCIAQANEAARASLPDGQGLDRKQVSPFAPRKQRGSQLSRSERRHLKIKPSQTTPESLETLYPEAKKAELAKLREELATLEKTPPELPSTMGVTEDEVANVAIHIRGNPSRLGDIVPRHFPPVMLGPASLVMPPAQSGRRELAQWLTDPQHPLTARVLVNRFWRWHFGAGLVTSTDNFGLLGERPTHPELLDWLARRFIADGWSLKAMHRLILNSSTYQQSSAVTEKAVELDPENRLWGHFPVRRLDAEEVRDAILFVSGQLDRTMGGSLLKVKNRGYLFDHTSIDTTDYNSKRRSLYLPVIRNNVFDLFQLLDFPDPAVPTGDRSTTTVAPQALMMMNSDFVMQAADDLAVRICADATEDSARLSKLYQLAIGREPTDAERSDDLAFLQQINQSLTATEPESEKPNLKAWSVLCHVRLASSEFIYVQ